MKTSKTQQCLVMAELMGGPMDGMRFERNTNNRKDLHVEDLLHLTLVDEAGIKTETKQKHVFHIYTPRPSVPWVLEYVKTQDEQGNLC